MSLAKVWVVKDPSNSSTLDNIFWEQEVSHLDSYILGSPEGSWTKENHAICATREEAEAEARARFTRLAERFAQAAASPSLKKGRVK